MHQAARDDVPVQGETWPAKQHSFTAKHARSVVFGPTRSESGRQARWAGGTGRHSLFVEAMHCIHSDLSCSHARRQGSGNSAGQSRLPAGDLRWVEPHVTLSAAD